MTALFRFAAALFGALLLAGCSGADILNLLTPRSGYARHQDLAYGTLPRQKLDIYVPESLHAPAPVIVFFHGGSWKTGGKEEYRFAGQAFASRGYVTVIAGYRLYPDAYFPDFVQDGAAAVAWVHGHIGDYGGDSGNIFVVGHSAGAYNALMLTVDRRYLEAAGGRHEWIRGAVGMAGPYDFLPFTDSDIAAIFSKEEDALTQPIHYVGPGLPPMLLLTGDADEDVRPGNSIRMAQAWRKYRNQATLRVYPGVGHIGVVLSLAEGFRRKAPVLPDVDSFIRSTVAR